jgi:hypothetical protein
MTVVLLLVPPAAITAAPAQPSTAPASTQPAADPPRVRVEVSKLLVALQDPEPRVRQRAAARAKNLAGEFADAVERAVKDDSVGEEARAALRAALPLINHRAREDAAAAALQDFEANNRLESYEKFGKKDPRWDAAVRAALAMRPAGAADPAVIAAYKKAADAGCDDPLVMYLYARTRWLAGDGDREEVLELHRDAAMGLSGTQYPAEW